MSRVLLDSNVFVYAFDPTDPAKHERAIDDDRVIEGVRFVNPFGE